MELTKQHAIIIGNPGIGRTLLAKKIAREWSLETITIDCINITINDGFQLIRQALNTADVIVLDNYSFLDRLHQKALIDWIAELVGKHFIFTTHATQLNIIHLDKVNAHIFNMANKQMDGKPFKFPVAS